jgi:large subunit ribosomal protein L25
MPEIVVAAQSRTETGKNANRRLRAQGLIPGVVYGPRSEAVPVSVSPKEIGAILRSASGENTLFEIDVAGSKRKVILKEFQVEPIGGSLLHADFCEVALDKLLEIQVHIELTGTPVGVKDEGGLLDFVTRELDVSCLPGDIPDKIQADVSHLASGMHLRVADIQAPPKVTILTEPEVVVAHVVVRREEEAEAEAEAPVDEAGEPEVAKKGGPGEETEAKGEKKSKEDRKAKEEK